MKRIVEISSFARADLADAFVFYEQRARGLGREFMAAFQAGLKSIQTLPAGYPVTDPPWRCYNMDRFPYGILYSFDATAIRIIAVKNHYRHPDFWKERL